MAVTLAEAKLNAQTDYDPMVIDEFRKESVMLDSLVFDQAVNPSGGGATLTYGYRRQATQATADTRALNSEYTPGNVTSTPVSVNLAVMGGSFEVDRVLSTVGPAASGAVTYNLNQKIKATTTRFSDEVINGNVAANANGFDGLNKALFGSSTEYGASAVTDWSALDTTEKRLAALDSMDSFLSLLDGTPTLLLGNSKALGKIRSIVRGTGMYVRNPVDGLLGANGRPISREEYGGIVFADMGEKAGSTNLIIPVRKQLSLVPTVTAGSGNITFKLNGQLVTLAYNANAAAWQAAIDAVLTGGTVSGSTSATLVAYPVGTVATITDGVGVTFADGTAGAAPATGLTDIYAVRIGLDGFHGVTTIGGQLVQTWLPDFSTAGAVKKGEVELGPVAVALKATKAAAVFRAIKVQ